MIGLLHDFLKDFVVTNYGQDKWEAVLAKTDYDELIDFHKFHRYDESHSKKLFAACVEATGLNQEEAMEAIGRHFFHYNKDKGHGNLISVLGIDLFQFCQSLNYTYWFLTDFAYKGMVMPTFRCEREDMHTIILHYFSRYPGLQYLFIGFIKEVAKELFKQDITITLLETNSQQIDQNTNQEHSIYKIFSEKEIYVTYERPVTWPNYHSVHIIPDFPEELQISLYFLCKILPYHMMFDNKMNICQMGINLQRLCSRYQVYGSKLHTFFRSIHPCIPLHFQNICETQNMVYILETKQDRFKYLPYLVLKGQMVWMHDMRYGIFMASLLMTSVTDLTFNHLNLNDLCLYDSTRALLIFNYLRNLEIQKCQALEDRITIDGKRVRMLLKENLRTNSMMVTMVMPPHILERIKKGLKVEIEELPEVSIVFCYIVDFNIMAGYNKPMDVALMIYQLYEKFEVIAGKLEMTRCEAAGPVFIYIGGLSELDRKHVEHAADMALGMVLLAADTIWPLNEEPLQVRVGIHSGPVVASLVGSKPRRYTVHGETVFLAGRMGTHCMPGMIHVSEAIYFGLKKKNYLLEPRGIIDVLDYGKLFTYWLHSNLDKTDSELKGIDTSKKQTEHEPETTKKERCCKSGVCDLM